MRIVRFCEIAYKNQRLCNIIKLMKLKSQNLPTFIYNLATLFRAHNFPLFLVGGSVRDFLLSRKASDFDFCTSALPNEIKMVLQGYKTIDVGAKYGTIGVIFKSALCEITTFRSERDYTDNRHPNKVAFERDINADLSRRDFTINALAFDILSGKLIDNFGGVADLKSKQIRAVGDANKRFSEDALRILRAFSLVAKFGFNIESATKSAIVAQKHLLKNISKERVEAEIIKILRGDFAPLALKEMKQIFAINMPKGFHKIPKNMRTFGAFLIFKKAQNLPEILQNKRTKNIEIIFNALDSALKNRRIYQRQRVFAEIKLRFEVEDIKIAIALKCATARKNRRLKKAFCAKRLDSTLKINGFDLQNLGFSGAQISTTKTQLLREIYSRDLPNERAHLLRKARELKGI